MTTADKADNMEGVGETLNQPMTENTANSKACSVCSIWTPLMSLTAVRVSRLSRASSIASAMLSEALLSCITQALLGRSQAAAAIDQTSGFPLILSTPS